MLANEWRRKRTNIHVLDSANTLTETERAFYRWFHSAYRWMTPDAYQATHSPSMWRGFCWDSSSPYPMIIDALLNSLRWPLERRQHGHMVENVPPVSFRLWSTRIADGWICGFWRTQDTVKHCSGSFDMIVVSWIEHSPSLDSRPKCFLINWLSSESVRWCTGGCLNFISFSLHSNDDIYARNGLRLLIYWHAVLCGDWQLHCVIKWNVAKRREDELAEKKSTLLTRELKMYSCIVVLSSHSPLCHPMDVITHTNDDRVSSLSRTRCLLTVDLSLIMHHLAQSTTMKEHICKQLLLLKCTAVLSPSLLNSQTGKVLPLPLWHE